MDECVEVTGCDSDTRNDEDQTELLDAMVLKTCGQLVFDLFRRFRNNEVESTDGDSADTISSSTATADDCSESSIGSTGETYLDALMVRAFDRLYDVMSLDLEKADRRFQTPPKLQLYHELQNFVCHYQLHQINRYVFGDEKVWDWGPITTDALTTVRVWRLKFVDETKVPNGLMESYKTATAIKELHPFDAAMVAFAVFGFLLGYDTITDYNILYMFRKIEDIYKPLTFQYVHNSVLRNTRLFLVDCASDDDETFFESLADNTDIKDVFNWIFDLMAENPGAVNKFTGNPFSDVQSVVNQIYDVNGKKMTPSYIIKLRIFYRWISMELFDLLSGRIRDRMSLLDHHVKQCLCCLSETSWLELFENVYVFTLKYFTMILNEYNCPNHMLKTFLDLWNNETLKDIIRFCVNKQICGNSYLNHRDSSTDSNESLGSSNSS
ncbi:uncharacterized protein LOC113551008 [Rhopalosiphum maidis]|uniref:uncharacterized protein LOC113551008 n=1 Tax=Rhopalosiphum maidis TaxID=43146 RepID=UPI000EFFE20B|nr:uncharacterized protein LOC113551008 [Rhopalosiphum maidis]